MPPPSASILPIGRRMQQKPSPAGLAATWTGGWPQSPEEFRGLLDTYLDRLVRYAFRHLGNVQDAEDVVQEVLVRAYADRSERRRISAVGPYLYRCVDNACTDLLRKKSRSEVFREELGIGEVLRGEDDPSQIVAAAEALRRAEQLLGRLPEKQAEVIRLRVFDELGLSEIAEVVGCPVNTVCSRLRYGFRRLRSLVAQQPE
jgi:RNA polymerase sigma-70 factor (ECF subfamily)